MKWTCRVAVGWLVVCAGCVPQPSDEAPGQAKDIIGPCLEAMGGLKRWSNVGPIHATAVVTIYDEAGGALVNEQKQVFNLPAGTLTASAERPDGKWTATVSQHGPPTFTSSATMPDKERSRIIGALQMMLHRVGGPLNLAGAETPDRPQRVQVGSMDLVRVGVRAGGDGAVAYYFDPRTYLLRLVTAGADAAGQDGTVTLYTYRMAHNGMAFPARLAVMKIGEHVLIGDEPVLEVDYRQVRFPR